MPSQSATGCNQRWKKVLLKKAADVQTKAVQSLLGVPSNPVQSSFVLLYFTLFTFSDLY